jgi:hypothetical protein
MSRSQRWKQQHYVPAFSKRSGFERVGDLPEADHKLGGFVVLCVNSLYCGRLRRSWTEAELDALT